MMTSLMTSLIASHRFSYIKKCLILLFLFISFNVLALGNVKLESCIDGDTARFIYDEKIITARFIGIDTPELNLSESYASEAANFTCEKLSNSKNIILEKDEYADLDKYDRYLVWVFVDDNLLQEELVARGLASTRYLKPKYKYSKKLFTSERKAKYQRKGIWSETKEKQDNLFLKIFKIIIKVIWKLIDAIISLFR